MTPSLKVEGWGWVVWTLAQWEGLPWDPPLVSCSWGTRTGAPILPGEAQGAPVQSQLRPGGRMCQPEGV